MFSGAQVSLYPMTDDFVDVITDGLKGLQPWRDRLRIETDDVSSLMVGSPEVLFPAMRDLLVQAASTGIHCVLSATVSRGCPGEPDDPICTPGSGILSNVPIAERIGTAHESVARASPTGQTVATQLSLYPLGSGHHMDEIYGCIEFLKTSGVFDRSKNFCTKLRGDAGPVFAGLAAAFTCFGASDSHVVLDITVSANSPSTV